MKSLNLITRAKGSKVISPQSPCVQSVTLCSPSARAPRINGSPSCNLFICDRRRRRSAGWNAGSLSVRRCIAMDGRRTENSDAVVQTNEPHSGGGGFDAATAAAALLLPLCVIVVPEQSWLWLVPPTRARTLWEPINLVWPTCMVFRQKLGRHVHISHAMKLGNGLQTQFFLRPPCWFEEWGLKDHAVISTTCNCIYTRLHCMLGCMRINQVRLLFYTACAC